MDVDSDGSSSDALPPSPELTSQRNTGWMSQQQHIVNPPLPRLPNLPFNGDEELHIIREGDPTHIITFDEDLEDVVLVDSSNDSSDDEVNILTEDEEVVDDADPMPEVQAATGTSENVATPTVNQSRPSATSDAIQTNTQPVLVGEQIGEGESSGSSVLEGAGAPGTPSITAVAGPSSSNTAGFGVVTQIDSPADFRSPKRRRIFSPPKPAKTEDGKQTDPTEEEDHDAECCPICYENWTNSGIHRLSSLKCGHLFGKSCIEKWLKGQGGKCPQCNDKAKKQDIRVIYAKNIKTLDTSERDRALKELELEKEARKRAELQTAELRLQCQLATEDTNRLRRELETHKAQLRTIRVSGTSSISALAEPGRVDAGNQISGKGHFLNHKTIKIWDAGKCRVMAFSNSLATLVVSQPSSSTLFPGFGLKKISTLDLKTSQYLTIHLKPIRDMAFHPVVDNGLLLSCGLDNKVKLTSLLSNTVVQSFCTPVPAWSCVWNSDDQNYFYVGLQNGLVQKFDVRNTDQAVSEISTAVGRSPVVSLKYLSADLNAAFRPGGLLLGQLDRVTFVEPTQDEANHRLHFLPLEGSLTSIHVEPKTRHLLASFRPTAKHPTIRHQLCEMSQRNSAATTTVDSYITCNIIQTFTGGKLQTVLSRTLLMPHPADQNSLMVCAGEEANNGINIWDTKSLQLKQKLLTGGITLDTCYLTSGDDTFIAALTDKQVTLFKWT